VRTLYGNRLKMSTQALTMAKSRRVLDDASISGANANISAFIAGPAAVTASRFAR
jgi:hypothetical protein